MLLFYPKESDPEETRTAIVPEIVKQLVSLGLDIEIESGLGSHLYYSDDDYAEQGAKISTNKQESYKNADIVLRLNKPAPEDLQSLKKGSLHISFLDPFHEHQLVEDLASAQVNAISMEMIPRISHAQEMDALSSQASLAGYQAVILAAERLDKILPMMMTPSGTIPPARIFIIGAGVAGLQAIATAKRLGARVEAFDTRPTADEQVKSLGAKFIYIDLGETGQTEQGYAKELTPKQLEKQRQALAKVCANSDIVITTAQLFGKKAPLIVTQQMVDAMRPGSVVVDMAAETGGNVECTVFGEEVIHKGVRIIGLPNLARQVPINASEAYANNLFHLIQHIWNQEEKNLNLNVKDDILEKCLITFEGRVINPAILELISSK
ncbi:MAG: NAD(P) transhydrogenase subunit alpha part 1 [Chlamydiae bacterium]|nr:NAD(P) transhydrogenase subunit alpha part 1 [Chlamydiota bacterium]